MFSQSVELILGIAYREATARRHTHLTLEHLLYVLAHDTEGERILTACGADLPSLRRELDRYLSDKLEQFPRGRQQEPEQTLAFRRTLQTAVLHVQSANRAEVQAGDLLAAMLQQTQVVRRAAPRAAGRHPARRPQLHQPRHREGAAARRRPTTRRRTRRPPAGGEEGASGRARSARRLHREPVGARRGRRSRSADRPVGRAAADARDPLPPPQEQPGVRRRSRRRQDGAGRRAGAAAAAGGRARRF